MDIYKENRIIEWLEHKENNSYTTYLDNNLPSTFHKVKKNKTNNEKYVSTKRYKYFSKLKEESKGCSICTSTKNLVIDHCHTSRKIRGVICDLCNKGLGNFRDSPKILENAISYLKIAKENENEALDYYSLQKGPRKPLEARTEVL